MLSVEVHGASAALVARLRQAIPELNSLQSEFQFNLPEAGLIDAASVVWRQEYSKGELLSWLQAFKIKAGGSRPSLILAVDGRLRSEKAQNLFAAHDAAHGVATFTTYDSGRFVHDEVRFIRYWLVRLCISFVAPALKSHAETRSCYFDFKNRKRDVLASMNSGGICDECRGHLAAIWTPAQKAAIEAMASFVAGDYPHALVMKGGGVKGLAFAGALLELEKYFTFDTFAGTSAGSLAALLLAAGCTPAGLISELMSLDFSSFQDGGWLSILRLCLKRGLHPGDRLQSWIDERMKYHLSRTQSVAMHELPSRAVLYSCHWGGGLLTFDSSGKRKETAAAFAARCSASIPFFFVPQFIEGKRAYDGGLRENFPLLEFMAKNPGKPTIGLFLVSPARSSSSSTLGDLIDIVTSGNEDEALRLYPDRIVVIDPSPVRTTDFHLTNTAKAFLIAVGRAAAAKFALQRLAPSDLTEAYVRDLIETAERLRALVPLASPWYAIS